MYKCNKGHVFEEPARRVEHITGINIPDGGYDESYSCCPECKSEEIYEAVECDYCQVTFSKDSEEYLYFKESGDIICNECLHDYCMENFGGDRYYGYECTRS